MKLHRFYVPSDVEDLEHDFWLHNQDLLNQWNRVLRFRSGQQVILFDGLSEDRLYEIIELKPDEAHLRLVTEMKRQVPSKDIYLFWSLLKKDKNDWVLQKCTELGVSHFIPLITARTEKTGFNTERAQKIITEAAEQCGRSDIPNIREPINVKTVLDEFKDKITIYVCQQGEENQIESIEQVGVMIGPEGGWTDTEQEMFDYYNVQKINLHDFTLRAETACVHAISKIVM